MENEETMDEFLHGKLGPLIPWDIFKLQLDASEIEAWSHLRYMANELGEPQKVIIAGFEIAIIWPSGAVTLYRYPRTVG